MRIYAPTGVSLPRITIKNFTLGKYTFFKGTSWTFNFTAHHLDAQNHSNPCEFMFERYADSSNNAERTNPAANMPFGIGRRSCIGKYLGELMVQVVLVNLLRDFEIE